MQTTWIIQINRKFYVFFLFLRLSIHLFLNWYGNISNILLQANLLVNRVQTSLIWCSGTGLYSVCSPNSMPWFYWLRQNGWLFCHRIRHNDRHREADLNKDCFWIFIFYRNIYLIVSFKCELLFSFCISIYFSILDIRKYVIKKIVYNICITSPWACYQQWL